MKKSQQRNIRFTPEMQIVASALMANTGDTLTKVVDDALREYAKQKLSEEEGAAMLIKMYEYEVL